MVTTVATCLEEAIRSLDRIGIDSARLDALVLLEHTSGHNRAWLLAHPEALLTPKSAGEFASLLERRVAREPVAYLTGQAWFYGYRLAVSPSVLIPRPETERLVEAVLAVSPRKSSVLEVGTGSGAIAIALQARRPDLKLTATDVSGAALRVARDNARSQGCEAIRFKQSDLLAKVTEAFDVVVTNLPYVAEGQEVSPETRWEPRGALYAGADGLDMYRQLFEQLTAVSRPPSRLVLEADPRQQQALTLLAEAAHYQLQSHTDYCYVFAGTAVQP